MIPLSYDKTYDATIAESNTQLQVLLESNNIRIDKAHKSFKKKLDELSELYNELYVNQPIIFSGKSELVRIYLHICKFAEDHEDLKEEMFIYFGISPINLFDEQFHVKKQFDNEIKTHGVIELNDFFAENFDNYFSVVKVNDSELLEHINCVADKKQVSKRTGIPEDVIKNKTAFIFENDTEIIMNYSWVKYKVKQVNPGYKIKDNKGNDIVLKKAELELFTITD